MTSISERNANLTNTRVKDVHFAGYNCHCYFKSSTENCLYSLTWYAEPL